MDFDGTNWSEFNFTDIQAQGITALNATTIAGKFANNSLVIYNYNAGAGEWELELTSPNGEIYRALSGTVTPIEEVVQ